MPLNNWSVASKVRKQISIKNVPVIGDFIDVSVTGKDAKILLVGGTVIWLLWRQFPSGQFLQQLIAAGATAVLTLYLCWRPSNNPEKTNYDLIVANVFRRRKVHFKKFSAKDLED